MRSWETADGEDFVTVHFQFKTLSENDVGYTKVPVNAKIPVVYATGGYQWIKVFDATNEGKSEIKSYSRVLIYSPYSLDLHEVVFIDSDGDVMKTSVAKTTATEEQKRFTPVVIDEQDLFTAKTSKKFKFTDEELKSIAGI